MANTIDAETLLNVKRAMHDQLMDAFLDLREFCTEKPPPETGSLLGPAEPAPELTQEQQEAMAEKRTMIVSIVRRLRNIEWMFGLVGQMRRQAARLQVSRETGSQADVAIQLQRHLRLIEDYQYALTLGHTCPSLLTEEEQRVVQLARYSDLHLRYDEPLVSKGISSVCNYLLSNQGTHEASDLYSTYFWSITPSPPPITDLTLIDALEGVDWNIRPDAVVDAAACLEVNRTVLRAPSPTPHIIPPAGQTHYPVKHAHERVHRVPAGEKPVDGWALRVDRAWDSWLQFLRQYPSFDDADPACQTAVTGLLNDLVDLFFELDREYGLQLRMSRALEDLAKAQESEGIPMDEHKEITVAYLTYVTISQETHRHLDAVTNPFLTRNAALALARAFDIDRVPDAAYPPQYDAQAGKRIIQALLSFAPVGKEVANMIDGVAKALNEHDDDQLSLRTSDDACEFDDDSIEVSGMHDVPGPWLALRATPPDWEYIRYEHVPAPPVTPVVSLYNPAEGREPPPSGTIIERWGRLNYTVP